ncbi:hypothetical protein NB688_000641 [Xanthomonas sacchari]|uniref:Uncharacterized protein n=1 Tax=Xanthomonas sacchari TaxID=56458 RepID=A0ABT3DTU8_9XANT|nr:MULTISPECIES: hypothetical protein [Xanthomonas]MCW0398827.1 hypothetical protein [Xanthomonas sacchari]MCW0418475.1 hypothetical protein [Xanthomonas sacchari]UYK72466.1 hypothetical protein NG828_20130 [Xanthomonas sacchari]
MSRCGPPARRAAVALLALSFASPLTAAPPAQPTGASPPPLLAYAAGQVGVKRCLGAIDGIARRTTAGALRQDLLLDWDRADPNGGALFSLTGLEYANASALLSVSAVPQTGLGCALLVEQISAAPVGCAELARTELAGYAAVPLLPSVTVYRRQEVRQETVVLADATPGCLVVRRQVQYGWLGGQW